MSPFIPPPRRDEGVRLLGLVFAAMIGGLLFLVQHLRTLHVEPPPTSLAPYLLPSESLAPEEEPEVPADLSMAHDRLMAAAAATSLSAAARHAETKASAVAASPASGARLHSGAPSAGTPPGGFEPALPTSGVIGDLALPDQGSVFSRSAIAPTEPALGYVKRGADLWTAWPDQNRINLVGHLGIDALAQAFTLVTHSGAGPIAADLFRKSIPIGFADQAEFSGPKEQLIAMFDPRGVPTPPARPDPLPMIKLNPRFATEPPWVLAAVLVHEGTHFQALLDGASADPALTRLDQEYRAWVNEATFWSEMRQGDAAQESPLAVELEVNYQFAMQGEGALRNLVAAVLSQSKESRR